MKTKKRFLTLLALFLSLGSVGAEWDSTITNTNFTLSSEEYTYNYNRLRLQTNVKGGSFFGTIIGDGVNYLGDKYLNSPTFALLQNLQSDTPFRTQTDFNAYHNGQAYAKIYRLYAGYEDLDNRITVGLQNIQMGVGRLWNPTNLFNPKNPTALEPDETLPVLALAYTRHIDDKSALTLVISQNKEQEYRYLTRYKTSSIEWIDIALSLLSSPTTKMIGYELEANLAETGIEVRSEGAYLKSTLNTTPTQKQNQEFFQGIIGADYGFQNGISFAIEALYTSQTFDASQIFINLNSEILPNLLESKGYLGATISYDFTLYLQGSLAYIESLDTQNSHFIAPALVYTLNDFNSFTLGAMLYDKNLYYLKYNLAF